MYRWLRALAFRLDPERAHRLALTTVRWARPLAALRRHSFEVSPVEAFGLRFRNPLGLAAGYDKDAKAWRALAHLGFGHVEVGTVTPRPQPGNRRPRLTRLVEQRALINRMGFPSDGVEKVARRLSGRRPSGFVLGVSIGPNADTPTEDVLGDYLTLVDRLSDRADYLAINVSSPNTEGLRRLEDPERLGPLLTEIVGRRDRSGHGVPLLVKLSPDSARPGAVAETVEASGADGIIMGNTTVSRPPGIDLASGEGGLSGAPLEPLALARLAEVTAATRLPVIACGGVMDGAGARRRLEAGAVLIQLYTGLVYRGPRLIREILEEVAATR